MVNVEKVILHEKYQSPKTTGKSSTKVQFDLAMLKVTRISRSGLKCSRPACLPKSHPEPGRRCFIAGRGDTGLNEIWLKFNNFHKIINLLFFGIFSHTKLIGVLMTFLTQLTTTIQWFLILTRLLKFKKLELISWTEPIVSSRVRHLYYSFLSPTLSGSNIVCAVGMVRDGA